MRDLDVKLRVDAQANRDRLLQVAREALAADPAASLNSIGKAAGVGAGTLYRHFPTRDALLVAVYRKEVEDLVELSTQLLAEHPPLPAFLLWCERLAKSARTKQGIAVALQSAATEEDHRATLEPMVEATDSLLQACRQSGDIRSDLKAEDFLTLVSFLWEVPTDANGQARARGLLAFVFQGMGVPDNAIRDALT